MSCINFLIFALWALCASVLPIVILPSTAEANGAQTFCANVLSDPIGTSKLIKDAKLAYEQFSIQEVPQLQMDQFTNIKEIPIKKDVHDPTEDSNAGLGNFGVFSADFAQKKVLIKFPNREDSSNIEQVRLVKLMDDLAVGPAFFGMVYDSSGKLGIVTEFISGANLTELSFKLPESIKINVKTLENLNKIVDRLNQSGVELDDLQFRIDFKGRLFVIDPERFSIRSWPVTRSNEKRRALLTRTISWLIK